MTDPIIETEREEVIRWLRGGRWPECGFTFKACHCGSVMQILLELAAESMYWETRAKEAELKVLTFHEEIATLQVLTTGAQPLPEEKK